MTEQHPPLVYALVASITFSSFVGAIFLSPNIGTWLGAGLAAVAMTALAYAYLEWRVPKKENEEAEEMFE